MFRAPGGALSVHVRERRVGQNWPEQSLLVMNKMFMMMEFTNSRSKSCVYFALREARDKTSNPK